MDARNLQKSFDLQEIRRRFDLVGFAVSEFGGVARRHGNRVDITDAKLGGLAIFPSENRWWLFSENVGGDCFDLCGYRKFGSDWFREKELRSENFKTLFSKVLVEASLFSGVEARYVKPEQKKTVGDYVEQWSATQQTARALPESEPQTVEDFNRTWNTPTGAVPTADLFKIQPVAVWIDEAMKRPNPQKLFDSLWHEGELCFLFSDTNAGKTVLAVQIANALSRGAKVQSLDGISEPQTVLYFDFEMNDKQFEARYSDGYKNHYSFSENFLRAELNPNADLPKGLDFDSYIVQQVEAAVIKHSARVVVVDNLTYLRSDTQDAKDALWLMKNLKRIKEKYSLSMLVLGHTPKRDLTKPLDKNALAGSKMLMNFCDSAFAIGESARDKDVRYLKQIKCRTDEFRYDAENVIVARVEKLSNFLQFTIEGFGTEREHLKVMSDSQADALDEQIVSLKQSEPFLSNREIAKRLNTNPMKVGRVLAKQGVTPFESVTLQNTEQNSNKNNVTGVTAVTGVTPVTKVLLEYSEPVKPEPVSTAFDREAKPALDRLAEIAQRVAAALSPLQTIPETDAQIEAAMESLPDADAVTRALIATENEPAPVVSDTDFQDLLLSKLPQKFSWHELRAAAAKFGLDKQSADALGLDIWKRRNLILKLADTPNFIKAHDRPKGFDGLVAFEGVLPCAEPEPF